MKTVYDESTETRGYGSDMGEQSHVLLDVYEGLIAGGASEEEARKRIWELLAKMGQRSGAEARKDRAQEQSSETDDSVKTYDPLAKAEESESSTQKDLSQMSAREREKEMDKLSAAAKEATAREAEEESAQMVPAVGKASPETKEAMRNGQPVSAREKAEVADDAMNSARAEKERKAQEAALEQERAAIGQSTDVPAETREAMRNGQAVPVAAKDKVVEQSEKAANAQKQRQAAMSNPPRTEEECRKKVEELKKLGGGVTEAIEQAENEGASAHEIYYRATSRGYYPGMDPKMAPSAGSGGKGLAGLPMAEEVTAARAGTKISSGKSEDECRKANDSMAKMGKGLDEAIALARERGLSEDEINAKLMLRGYHPGMDPKLLPGVDELKGGGIGGLPTVQDITRWKKNEAAGITSKGQFAPKPKPEEEAPVQMSSAGRSGSRPGSRQSAASPGAQAPKRGPVGETRSVKPRTTILGRIIGGLQNLGGEAAEAGEKVLGIFQPHGEPEGRQESGRPAGKTGQDKRAGGPTSPQKSDARSPQQAPATKSKVSTKGRDPLAPGAPRGLPALKEQHGGLEMRSKKKERQEWYKENGWYEKNGVMFPPDWEKNNLVTIDVKDYGKIKCNKAIAKSLRAVFDELRARNLLNEVKPCGGCYNPRAKRNYPDQVSVHGWGLAIDLNAGAHWTKPFSDEIINVFASHGFKYGGDFGDPMHFQYVTGY